MSSVTEAITVALGKQGETLFAGATFPTQLRPSLTAGDSLSTTR
jgi:hypothetical protein